MSDFEQWVLNEARKATALPQPCVIGWPEQLQIARAIASKVEEETRERLWQVCENDREAIDTLPSKYKEPT